MKENRPTYTYLLDSQRGSAKGALGLAFGEPLGDAPATTHLGAVRAEPRLLHAAKADEATQDFLQRRFAGYIGWVLYCEPQRFVPHERVIEGSGKTKNNCHAFISIGARTKENT